MSLSYNRVCHSTAYLTKKYWGRNLHFVASINCDFLRQKKV